MSHHATLKRLVGSPDTILELALDLDQRSDPFDRLGEWLDQKSSASEIRSALARLLGPAFNCRRASRQIRESFEAGLLRAEGVKQLADLHGEASEAEADLGYLENLLAHTARALASELVKELLPLQKRFRLPLVPPPGPAGLEREGEPATAERIVEELGPLWKQLPERSAHLEADLRTCLQGLLPELTAELTVSVQDGLGWKVRRPGRPASADSDLWRWQVYLGELGLAYCYGVQGIEEALAQACATGAAYQGPAPKLRFGRLSQGVVTDLLGNSATVHLVSAPLRSALEAADARAEYFPAQVAGQGHRPFFVVNALEHQRAAGSATPRGRLPPLARALGAPYEWVVSTELRAALEAAAPFAGRFEAHSSGPPGRPRRRGHG